MNSPNSKPFVPLTKSKVDELVQYWSQDGEETAHLPTIDLLCILETARLLYAVKAKAVHALDVLQTLNALDWGKEGAPFNWDDIGDDLEEALRPFTSETIDKE